jgi:hypothetical protein
VFYGHLNLEEDTVFSSTGYENCYWLFQAQRPLDSQTVKEGLDEWPCLREIVLLLHNGDREQRSPEPVLSISCSMVYVMKDYP